MSSRPEAIAKIREAIDQANSQYKDIPTWVKDSMLRYFMDELFDDDGTMIALSPDELKKLRDRHEWDRRNMTIEQRLQFILSQPVPDGDRA